MPSRRSAGLRPQTQMLRGETVDELVAYADTIDADLIVVGSRGHGTIASALLGSVSRGVLSEARRPVLIVRPERRSGRSKGVREIPQPGRGIPARSSGIARMAPAANPATIRERHWPRSRT